MSQNLKTIVAIIIVVVAIAIAVWSGWRYLRPPQGREIGKLPGTFPTKEQEAGIAPTPQPGR